MGSEDLKMQKLRRYEGDAVEMSLLVIKQIKV